MILSGKKVSPVVHLLSEHDQYNQVTSSWHMVRSLVHSTLDANRWQLHAVQPRTCKCMQRSMTSNLKISGNKVRDTSRSFNQGKRSTVLLPFDYTWHLSVRN